MPAHRRGLRVRPSPGTSSARRPARARAVRSGPPAGLLQQPVDGERQEDAGHDGELLQGARAGHGCAAATSRRCRRARSPTRCRRRCRRRFGQSTTISTLGANAVPIALTKKNSAAIFMTEMRPMRSAIRPADMAPAAAPSSAEATAKPNSALPMPKSSWMEVDGTVDDGAVVAEQQAAQRGHRCDSNGGAARREVFVGDRRRTVGYGWSLAGHGVPFAALRDACHTTIGHRGDRNGRIPPGISQAVTPPRASE